MISNLSYKFKLVLSRPNHRSKFKSREFLSPEKFEKCQKIKKGNNAKKLKSINIFSLDNAKKSTREDLIFISVNLPCRIW